MSVRLYLIRHGRAASTWSEARDPPLDAVGRAQAETVVRALSSLAPLPIVTSPLLRCRETAAPLARHWGQEARIVDAVREIPAPMEDLAGRGAWVNGIMTLNWRDLLREHGDLLKPWRAQLIDTILGFRQDSVIFTHYMVINVAVGLALSSDRVASFKPDHASITKLDVSGGNLTLVELGREGETRLTSG